MNAALQATMVGAALAAARHAHVDQRLVGQARVHVPPWLRLPALSLGVLGAQTVWSMDMVFAPPYLLDLGLSKSAMAAVFLAGPLSGLIVQPLIGSLADSCTSRFGRRRPYLAIAVVVCSISILILGFARELAGYFTERTSSAHQNLGILFGILGVFLVDFSVNAVTALDRALMVDVATVQEQAEANAWAARLCGLGAVTSFLIGNLDLPALVPSIFGTTQIQIVSVLVSVILLSTHACVLWLVQEQVLSPHSDSLRPKDSIVVVFQGLVQQAKQLPPPILEIFRIQFFAQMGWFPVLFYSTVWVGEIYKADVRANGGTQSDHELFEQATRVGSRAFLWHATLSLLTSMILPLLVPNPVQETTATRRMPLLRQLHRLRNDWPDLPFWWVFVQFVFFIAMMGTWLAGLTQSVFLATLVVASVGFCFAVCNWVPFSILGILIQTQTVPDPIHHRTPSDDVTLSLLRADRHSHVRSSGIFEQAKTSDDGHSEHDVENAQTFGQEAHPNDDLDSAEVDASGQTGTILGLHNVSIVLPQFVVTGISSLIFAMAEPAATTPDGSRGAEEAKNGDALGLIFRLGGCSALIAGIFAVRFVRRYRDTLSGQQHEVHARSG